MSILIDGFVKSPSAVLRGILSHCGAPVSAPHSFEFARLAPGAFYFAVQFLTFYEFILIRVLLILFVPSPLLATEISWGGFIQGNYSVRTTGEAPPDAKQDELILGEERLQLKLSAYSEPGDMGLFVKGDFFHDTIEQEVDVDLREGYLDYTQNRFDLRVGRQIITWGVGDLLFINDVFPKDWQALFSGRPLEYLKIGVDGAKIDFYSQAISAELVIIPFFEPDNLPASDRFFLFDPYPQVKNRQTQEPSTNLENTEVALRLYRYIGDADISFYLYKGFYKTPGMEVDDAAAPQKISYFYPELTAYGLSVQGNKLGGVVSIEAGYHDSLDDRDGKDPAIENSQSRLLLGYQKSLADDLTIGIQYYGEYIHKYSAYKENLPPSSPQRNRLRQYITIRITSLFKYQTLKLSLFGLYSPDDEDYFLNPQISYQLTDQILVAIGGNVFGGKEQNTAFGQHDKNDNVYATLKYSF